MSFTSPFIAVMALAALSVCAGAEVQVKTTSGTVEGTEIADGLRVFKGIPFAEPPVGNLRWKPPQPIKARDGIRQAQTFGSAPVQDAGMAELVGVPAPFSEDCLYLNVWTPAKREGERLPVMVWIHGGAFDFGATSQPVFDGADLAREGVVVVSVAYRTGVLGFLSHPELTQEGKGGGRSGNYGLLDQIAGLKWVQENIAAFDGDPANLTIFGESAGGIAVGMLAQSPQAKGLFQRAISQSGGSFDPPRLANEGGIRTMPLRVAERQGERYLKSLGVESIEDARKLPAADLLRGDFHWWPIYDGEVLPGDPVELYRTGRFNDTPILIGTTSDEGATFASPDVTPESFRAKIRSGYGEYGDKVLTVYPHATAAEAYEAIKDIFRDADLAWHTWTWAKLQALNGKGKAFVYYLDHRTPEAPDGARHALDLPYVFGNFVWGGQVRPEDKELSDLMQAYWVNFARTGNPNGEGLPVWPAFDLSNQQVMELDATPSVQPLPNRKQLEALDGYFQWRREQAKRGRQ